MLFFKMNESNAPVAEPIVLLKVLFGFDAESIITRHENGDIDYRALKQGIGENEEFKRAVIATESKVIDYLEQQLLSSDPTDFIIKSVGGNPNYFLNYIYSTSADIFGKVHYQFHPELVHTTEHGLIFKKGSGVFSHYNAMEFVDVLISIVVSENSLRLSNIINKISLEERYARLVASAATQFANIDIDKKIEDFLLFFKQEASVTVEDEVIDL